MESQTPCPKSEGSFGREREDILRWILESVPTMLKLVNGSKYAPNPSSSVWLPARGFPSGITLSISKTTRTRYTPYPSSGPPARLVSTASKGCLTRTLAFTRQFLHTPGIQPRKGACQQESMTRHQARLTEQAWSWRILRSIVILRRGQIVKSRTFTNYRVHACENERSRG